MFVERETDLVSSINYLRITFLFTHLPDYLPKDGRNFTERLRKFSTHNARL